MNKILFCILLMVVTASCKTKPFLKHSMKFEKVADDCSGLSNSFKMNSNLNGERYEFQRCLDVDFQKTQLTSIRQGDTVILKFERTKTKAMKEVNFHRLYFERIINYYFSEYTFI